MKTRIFSNLKPGHHTRNYVVLGLLLSLVYLLLFVFQARVDIQLNTSITQSTFFRLYWAGPDQGFSEKRMAYTELQPGRSSYFLYLDSLSNIERIRIDPLEQAGQVQLKSLVIRQWNWQPIRLQQLADYGSYQANQQIKLEPADNGLNITTTGRDGHFQLTLEPQRHLSIPFQHILALAAIWLTLGLLMLALRPSLMQLRFVPLLLLFSWSMVLLMALHTDLNLHPDEVVHLEAVNYYADHLLPPSLDGAEIASSYSIYGHTRLSNYEVYYQLAGYFQAIPRLFNASALIGARAFGLLLLALLTLYSLVRPAFRAFTLPLLLSAQAWYLFSYTNSDGFALALTLFAAYLAANPESMLNRFLQEQRPTAYLAKAAGLGLILGSLLLLKINYYFFILFLLLYLGWRLALGDFPNRALLFRRLAVLGLVALSVYGLRFALDINANGWDSAELQLQMQQHYATPEYKPGTPLADKNPMIRLRDRGYSAAYTLDQARWFEKIFQSAFGVYGFSRFYASQSWYELVRYLALALLVVLAFAALGSRRHGNHWLLILVSLCAGGLILTSAWNSWTVVFQPQGRYLMPILPMLAILYHHLRKHHLHSLIEWLSILLFILAAYSFVNVGMKDMGVALW